MSTLNEIHEQIISIKREVDKLSELITTLSAVPTQNELRFIDLFCGVGGFHQALHALGGKCVYACDIDEKCRIVYENNYGLKPDSDITKVDADAIPDFDVLCGGFPCQAFSHAGKQNGFEDTRGTLFRDVIRILKAKKPRYFLLENVKNLANHDEGRTWIVIKNALKEVGYLTYEEPIVMSPHLLGIPQHRERVLILGWRNDILNDGLPPLPTFIPTESNIASILEPDAISETLDAFIMSVLDLWEEFVQHFKQKNSKLPTFPIWSDDWDSVYELKDLPDWKAKFVTQNRDFYATHKQWLEPWLQRARANSHFVGAKRKFEWQCGMFQKEDSLWKLLFQFRPSGIRVKRTNYSPALVAMTQIVYVGEKRRKLTPREVARLQSFPDSFNLPSSSTVAYKQFGNSVNVEVIKWAAQHLLSHKRT